MTPEKQTVKKKFLNRGNNQPFYSLKEYVDFILVKRVTKNNGIYFREIFVIDKPKEKYYPFGNILEDNLINKDDPETTFKKIYELCQKNQNKSPLI